MRKPSRGQLPPSMRARRKHNPQPRFPVEPALAIGRRRWQARNSEEYLGDGMLAPMFHCNRRQIFTWKERGLSMSQAENIADRLDLSPSEIWEGWWETLNDYYDRLEGVKT